MIDYFRPGGPFHQALTNQFGHNLADYIRDTMVRAILTGQGPRYVGRVLAQTFGMGLSWSLRTARTSILYARREAVLAGYRRNSNVVRGWVWHADIGSSRTCLSCIVQHGQFHTLDERLNDHHNGRCAMSPQTVPWSSLGVDAVDPAEIRSGWDWFLAQPPSAQRSIMGPSMYDAWRDGRVGPEQFTTEYHDSIYGVMKRTPSLRDLLGGDAAQYYP